MVSLARKRRSVSSREQIKCATLEVAIATAVQRSDPRCGPFIGVFIERRTPKSRDDANWAVKGVKFGERQNCNAALSVIVERLKREFEISD